MSFPPVQKYAVNARVKVVVEEIGLYEFFGRVEEAVLEGSVFQYSIIGDNGETRNYPENRILPE